MLGLSKSGLRRLTRQRRFFAVATNASDSAGSENVPKKHQNHKSSINLSEEHISLQNKYRKSLVTKDLKTIHELIDAVEWKDSAVIGTTLNFSISLLSSPSQNIASLSDRELGVIISIFGEKADSTPPSKRSEHLKNAIDILNERGAVLGPLAKNAILRAKLDNGETVNVIETLQEWEQLGLSPNEETYQVLARSYALQGNVQGVINIINHVKSSGLTVNDVLIESMLHVVARTGSFEQSRKLLVKFSTPANDVRLRCAIAKAACARGDYKEAVEIVTGIPSTSKPNIIENNKNILELYLDLLEADQISLSEELKLFLTTIPDGSTLTEWHQNPKVIARIRKSRYEGKILPALNMYSIVHSAYRSPRVEDLLRQSASSYFHGPGITMKDVDFITKRLHEQGLIGDADIFLLDSNLPSSLFIQHFNKIRNSDKIYSYLATESSKRYKFAKRLCQPLVDENSSSEERALALANVGITCLSPSKEINGAEFYNLLYKLGGHDINLVIKAIQKVPQNFIRKEFATAFVQKLLSDSSDALADEKLNQLLQSGAVRSINASRLFKQLEKRVLNRRRNEEEDQQQLKTVASLIALDFPEGRAKELYAVNHIVNLLKNESVDDERARILISFMEKEERIGIPSASLVEAQKTLRDLKQDEKANLLFKLKRKNTTHSRWMDSSVEKLEEEWHRIRSDPKFSKDVVSALHDVFFRKLHTEKPANHKIILKYLNTVKKLEKGIPSSTIRLWQMGMMSSLEKKDMDAAFGLWEIRPTSQPTLSDHALCYISTLFVNGDIEKANVICEDLRASAAIISSRSLESVSKLLDGTPVEKLNTLTEYLSNKFGLKAAIARRIVYHVKINEMNQLIESGKLTEAFDIACEESQITGSPFGHFELFAAAFKNGDGALAKNVHNLIRSYVGQNNATLDTALAFLFAGLNQEAMKLFSSKGLTITSRKLRHFVNQCVNGNKPEVLKGLFMGLSEGERASTVDLNDLLLALCKIYYKANDLNAIANLEQEVIKRSFPVDEKIRNVFESVEKQRRSSKK